MNCETILQNLPVSIYLAKWKIGDEFEIVDFKLIQNANFTDYSEEELSNINILKNAFNENELKTYIQIVKELSIKGSFVIEHSFKNKSGKIIYFKNYLRLLEVTNDIYVFLGVVIDISKEYQLTEIFNSIYKSPFIGIAIYKERIILADDILKEMFEIKDEIYNMHPLDLIPDEYKDIAKKNLERRLKGEKFSQFYSLELKTFKDRRVYIEMFAETIFYDGGYAGIAFFIDKTKLYRNNLLLKLSLEVDNSIVTQNDEKSLLEDIYKRLQNIKYFNKIVMNEILEKEIKIDNDYNDKNYKSYLYLPIIVDNEVVGSYSFYSIYKDDFSQEVVSALKDIQYKIALAIKNIRNQKSLIILKNAIDRSYQWFLIVDENKKIIYANDAVEEISKYKKDELIGKNPNIFKSGFHSDRFYKNLWDKLTQGEVFDDILVNRDKNGHLFYLKDKIIPVKINNETYYVSLGVDITREKMLEKEISSIRYKDNLTKLLNRDGFLFYAEKKLKENKQYALFIIDIDDFKFFNEIKGNKYGDLILQEFAKFLEDIFYSSDLIARIGNDEFAILVEFKDFNILNSIINKLIDKVKQKRDEIPISIKVGIAIYPQDANNIKELIEKAYIALSVAKQLKNGIYKFYSRDISNEIENYVKVKNLIYEAIKNDEFIFFYQPYVDSFNFNYIGAESLLRIKKDNTIIPPNVFIDYAESSEIIKNIEILMIKKLINVIKETKFSFSFNLSGISLKDEEHINKLIEISKEYAKFLTIEITERELIKDLNYTKKIFALFKDAGFKISIDDFGTGYSSLTYISNLPIDILKIDISFIKDIDKNKKNLIIVDTIINFAKKLNLKTVAEGVETKKQIDILQHLGCDYLQGYYFAKPMPLEELKKVLKEEK